jgi:hypothetical protein
MSSLSLQVQPRGKQAAIANHHCPAGRAIDLRDLLEDAHSCENIQFEAPQNARHEQPEQVGTGERLDQGRR